jgi:hypothetical protein
MADSPAVKYYLLSHSDWDEYWILGFFKGPPGYDINIMYSEFRADPRKSSRKMDQFLKWLETQPGFERIYYEEASF